MPYVSRDANGNITGAFPNPQPGRAEEWVDDNSADLVSFQTRQIVQRAVIVGFARFTIAGGVVTATADSVGVGTITRISAGRYRVYYLTADPTQTIVAQPDYLDTVFRVLRIQAPRNPSYVEIRVADLAGVAADPPEVTVLLNRVVS